MFTFFSKNTNHEVQFKLNPIVIPAQSFPWYIAHNFNYHSTLNTTDVSNGIFSGQVMARPSASCFHSSLPLWPSKVTFFTGLPNQAASLPSDFTFTCVPGAGTVIQNTYSALFLPTVKRKSCVSNLNSACFLLSLPP